MVGKSARSPRPKDRIRGELVLTGRKALRFAFHSSAGALIIVYSAKDPDRRTYCVAWTGTEYHGE